MERMDGLLEVFLAFNPEGQPRMTGYKRTVVCYLHNVNYKDVVSFTFLSYADGVSHGIIHDCYNKHINTTVLSLHCYTLPNVFMRFL